MVSRYYSLYGWRVRSDIELGPGVLVSGTSAPDLTFTLGRAERIRPERPEGTVLAEFPPGESRHKMYWLTSNAHGFVLRFPGYAQFEATADLREVFCRASPGLPPAQLSEFFCGNVMSLLLGLAGAAVFHASAVALGPPAASRALGIFGRAGAGKSTLAALLVAVGARFLTDDVLRAGDEGGVPCIVGGCAELRLRPDAAHLAGLFPDAPVRPTADQRVAVSLGHGSAGSVPLGLLVFPRISNEPGGDVSISAMSGRQAALRLAGVPRVAGWSSRAVLEAQFRRLAEMAALVPALEACLPRSLQRAPALGEELAERLGAILAPIERDLSTPRPR